MRLVLQYQVAAQFRPGGSSSSFEVGWPYRFALLLVDDVSVLRHSPPLKHEGSVRSRSHLVECHDLQHAGRTLLCTFIGSNCCPCKLGTRRSKPFKSIPASSLRPLITASKYLQIESTDMPRKLPLQVAAPAECQVSEITLMLMGGISTDGCIFLRRIRAKDTGGGDGWLRSNKRKPAGAEQIQIPQLAVDNRHRRLLLTRSRAAPGIAATVTTGTARHGSSRRPGTRSGLFPRRSESETPAVPDSRPED